MATLKVTVLKLHLKMGTPTSDPEKTPPPHHSNLLIWSHSSYHLSPQAWPSCWNITAEIGHKHMHFTMGTDFDYLPLSGFYSKQLPLHKRILSSGKARAVPQDQGGAT